MDTEALEHKTLFEDFLDILNTLSVDEREKNSALNRRTKRLLNLLSGNTPL